MSRAVRLLCLLQTLRRYNHPVTASTLATELEVSERTLYRDVAALMAQGAPIYGEAGVGYVLRPGLFLPPLMFSEDEIEAVVLGLRYVDQRGDFVLTNAAAEALAKIRAVLPNTSLQVLESPTVLPGPPSEPFPENVIDLTLLRTAIQTRTKIHIIYTDVNGICTDRIVWPIVLGFLNYSRVLVAKCELRQDYRYFLTHRVLAAKKLNERYPERRNTLLREWASSRHSLENKI